MIVSLLKNRSHTINPKWVDSSKLKMNIARAALGIHANNVIAKAM